MNSAYGVETRAEIDKLVQFNNLSEGKDAQSDIKYRMPVTFGASLRFDLSDDCTESFGNDSVKISHSCSGITFFLLVYYFKFPGCEKKERYVWESF